MKTSTVLFAFLSFPNMLGVEAYVPSSKTIPKAKPVLEAKKAAVGAFAAFTFASSIWLTSTNPPPADAAAAMAMFSSSTTVAEKVTREGVYFDYEIDVQPQKYDDARSTFKPASETKSNKGKYTALLAILIVGSFIIPMAQYFWYVRDDDSSDKFFAKNVPEPKEPPKKKWF